MENNMSDDVFRPQNTGVQINGNIPPELAARLGRNQAAQNTNGDSIPSFSPESVANPTGYSPQMADSVMGMNPTNTDFQNLLNLLKGQSSQFEEVTLPSIGKFYDGTDGPTNGILHIKPMTGEEEQILATPRFVKKGQAVNMIFSRCIQEQFRPENLLSVDRTFLLIYLRGISYGSEYEVEVKDPDSDRKFTTVIDLDSLSVERCPEDYGPILSDKLPKTGLRVAYRLSRGKDETELQEHRERRLKVSGDTASDDSLLFRTAQLVESIETVVNKNEIMALLRNLPIQDLSYIRNLVTDPPFGVETKVSIISPVSSEEFEIELPLEANFFFPRNRKKDKTQV
jgi:hypothetical protein